VEEEVIEKPPIADEVILRALEECYGIRATRLEFVPRGLDPHSWAYRAEAHQRSYFVKVSKGRVDEAGAWAPMFLAEQGFREAIAPILSGEGAVLGRVDDLTLRVQPFVAGERGTDVGMSHERWGQLGAFLGRLHRLAPTEESTGAARRETFIASRLDWVEALNDGTVTPPSDDQIVAEMMAFWRSQRSRVVTLIQRMRALRDAARAQSWPMVLCHGDIHSGNVLLAADGRLFVVDWDDVALAPKERDLMFVLSETDEGQQAAFLDGYGPVQIDALALAYYRHDWCVEDIGAFGSEIMDLDAGGKTRSNALRWFKYLFEPGHAVSQALAEPLETLRP